ncbi:hypothetical protein SAMD00019534_098190 [Acytostelium subglobosum LB1]|uniref:hypothetical protein n=1 Tax=Acytostelium subglobosum LB1 TaxID=1410327 RepID=UPI000645019F|nr:hypothetical protein SAMD00019534_098190 [Acytostelium subglobosum LB1]GAM26644.1 hypothetical protein SAMD00019534_098190 [Acytostelium subglobosum LB1]|eukprot:XP_012750305.1 hypothetical protein SAMD00019534_098190 [Acytostelium subglobosum LB1]
MANEKTSKKEKDKKATHAASQDNFKGEEVLQGIVLGDSFDRRFAPITLERPRTLLPLVNIPLLDYTLELLASSGVQEIYVLCCAHADQIKTYLDNSRWSHLPGVQVRTVFALGSKSTGDALRFIYSLNIIQSDFVLISGDVISNMNLSNALKVHKARREKDKNNIMTMVFKQASPSHRTRSKQDDYIVGFDRDTLQLACYENSPKKTRVSLSSELFTKHPSIQLRYDLIDCHIDICSHEVLALFSDNFDFGDLRKDFIHDCMQSEITDYKLFTYILQGEYAARVKDLRTYNSVSKDIIHRWTFPMVPDNNFMCNTTYTLSRQMIYKERHVTLKDCTITEESVIGRGTVIGDKSVVSHSIIGRNVKIGNNVRIDGAYIWDNVVINDGVAITSSMICEGAVIGANATICKGVIVSLGVTVGDNVMVDAFTKITAVEDPDGGEDMEFGRSPTEVMNIGSGGVGWRWKLPSGQFNELVPRLESDPVENYTDEEDDEDEDSDEDDEDDQGKKGGRSKDKTDLAKFRSEVIETVKVGINQNHSIENIILEINGLKFGFDKDFMDCATAVLPALLDVTKDRSAITQKEYVALLNKRIDKYSKILGRYLTDTDTQVDFIFKIQDMCDEDPVLQKVIQFILHALYNNDILSEEALLNWAEELEEDAENESENQVYLKQCSQFLEWLREAEEEEEGDEDEDDDDEDDEDDGSSDD